MKIQKETPLELLKKELEFRNYSSRTVETYCSLMSRMTERSGRGLEDFDLQMFKSYLHQIVIGGG